MIARKSREDPKLTAPEIREELGLSGISSRTVQRRLAEVLLNRLFFSLSELINLGWSIWSSSSRKDVHFAEEC